jgi:hypothetical protein
MSVESSRAGTRLTHVSLLVALAFLAASSKTTADEQTVEKKKATTYSAGQKAAVDPDTKKLRAPSHEESEALDAQAKPAVVPAVTPTVLSNGAVRVELPEEYMDASVVQKNPDGSLTVQCVRGMAAADALVRAESKAGAVKPAPVPAPTDKGAKNPAELEKE